LGSDGCSTQLFDAAVRRSCSTQLSDVDVRSGEVVSDVGAQVVEEGAGCGAGDVAEPGVGESPEARAGM
jgi:hypothetical protein